MRLTDQCDGHPTIYVAVRTIVGLLPIRRKVVSNAFQHNLNLHSKEDICRDNQRGELMLLLDAILQVILLFPFLPSGGTSTETSSDERGIQYSRHACCEYCLSLSAIVSGSVDPPSAWTSPWMLLKFWVVTL